MAVRSLANRLRQQTSRKTVQMLGEGGATYSDDVHGEIADISIIFRETGVEADQFGVEVQRMGKRAWIERRLFPDRPQENARLTRADGSTYRVTDYAPAGGGLWLLYLNEVT